MGKAFIRDTSNFYSIDSGDILYVNDQTYKVIGHAKEQRFGIGDPKFWVKKVINQKTEEIQYIKLAFFESFQITLGEVKINCFRSPEKEGKILELVEGHSLFMQGKAFNDEKGNNVRVLDVVRGQNFLQYLGNFSDMTYPVYFRTILPGILRQLSQAFEAISFLHRNGFKHGDIRNDHLFVEKATGNYVWIDFDYDYETTENPFSLDIFGLGNILTYAIGKGFHTVYMIQNERDTYGDLIDRLTEADFSILDKRRLVNLRKLYPIIPSTMNNILMHFSKYSEIFYEMVDEIIEDINRCGQAFDEL
ncbi:protein kinase [uncultured Desulfobacter sp.]|uniref:protein kinase n=1 Tax=uncultured Desulfobacter sp. TaxID=240139 RepID=UPI002AABFBDB|nr:protein kinase [uncultured Desulfobacter sp.]